MTKVESVAAAGLGCYRHYRHVVSVIDGGMHEGGMSAIDRAHAYLEQVKANDKAEYEAVMSMLDAHYEHMRVAD